VSQRPPGAGPAGSSSAGVTSISRGGAAAAGASGRTRAAATVVTGGAGGAAAGGHEPYLNRKLEFAPPPEGGQPFTLFIEEMTAMPAMTFLDTLYQATSWNIIASPGIEEVTLRFWITNMTPQQALAILRFNGVYYEFDAETEFLYVQTNQEYLMGQHGAIEQEDFKVTHADVVDIEAVLTSLLSPNGRLISEPRTGRILAWDTADNLAEMRSLVTRLDVPVEPRAFFLKHINVADIETSIADLLTERGTAFADPRTNTVNVTDLPSRIARIAEFIKHIDIELETRTWTLNYVDPADVTTRLEGVVPEEMGDTVVDTILRQVTVTALPSRLEEIDTLITSWDVKRRQVEIEAYLVSSAANVIRNLGVNWFYVDEESGNTLSLGSGSEFLTDYSTRTDGQLLQFGALPFQRQLQERVNPFTNGFRDVADIAGTPIVDPVFGNAGLSVALNYLDSIGDISILSRPRVTVMDGEQASFMNTEDRPFQEGGVSGFGNQNNTGTGFRSGFVPLRVRFITVGTVLNVLPTITEENNVLMEVLAEESTADTVTVTVADQSSTVPQKRQSTTTTKVLVQSGQTIVIGGLRSATFQDDVTKVPLLGDLPLLGRLFKSTEKDHRERELMVFITPTIVDEFTQDEAKRLSRFEQSVSSQMREDRKTPMGRMQTRMTKGENEFKVAVGQTGSFLSDGEDITQDDLYEALSAIKNPSTVTLVLRVHPRAPKEAVEALREKATELGLKVEIDDKSVPFVPVPRIILPDDEGNASPAN
jgi:type II secretory pathway component GspD/PulD (secretin)